MLRVFSHQRWTVAMERALGRSVRELRSSSFLDLRVDKHWAHRGEHAAVSVTRVCLWVSRRQSYLCTGRSRLQGRSPHGGL